MDKFLLQVDKGMTLALDCAKNALANNGTDPSNGAYWWDGLDFKTNYAKHDVDYLSATGGMADR